MTKVLIPLADGFETIEAMIAVDVFKRAGFAVTLGGLDSNSSKVKSEHGVVVSADAPMSRINPDEYDVLFLVGGCDGGVKLLRKDQYVVNAMRSFVAQNKIVGAICAAPYILGELGLLDGKSVTCYPDEEFTSKLIGAKYEKKQIVIDGNIFTGIGPSSAIELAFSIAEACSDIETVSKIVEDMQFNVE